MTAIFAKIDVEKVFARAKEMTQKANSEKEYKAAAREWKKLHFDGCEFYFKNSLKIGVSKTLTRYITCGKL